MAKHGPYPPSCGLKVVDLMEGQKAEVDAMMAAECDRTPEMLLLSTHPGIGPVAAFVMMAEIGDIKRFPTAKKLVFKDVGCIGSSGRREATRAARFPRSSRRWAPHLSAPSMDGGVRTSHESLRPFRAAASGIDQISSGRTPFRFNSAMRTADSRARRHSGRRSQSGVWRPV